MEASTTATQFPINYGLTTRFHNLANIDTAAADGKTGVSIFRSTPMAQPMQLTIMERHPLSSQAFYPLSGRPYLVAVAPAGDFDSTAIQLFLAGPQQGVNYYPGTWHHYSLALFEPSDFLVVDRLGEGPNCDEVTLPDSIIIDHGDLPL